MNIRELAARVEPGRVQQRGTPAVPEAPRNPSKVFAEELRRVRESSLTSEQSLRISAHAQQRLEQREISFTPAEQREVAEAVHTLAEKGAQDALLLRADAAFVVNVPSRTIVTALGRQELGLRVFTNIDSAMLLQDQ